MQNDDGTNEQTSERSGTAGSPLNDSWRVSVLSHKGRDGAKRQGGRPKHVAQYEHTAFQHLF